MPIEKATFTRRSFLIFALALAAGGLLSFFDVFRSLFQKLPKQVPGQMMGASFSIGHLLGKNTFPPPSRILECGVVIVGGGISGLSAAWWLKRNGYDDFTLLELESEVGGNSRYGKNTISAYPWGAHYLPLPGPEAKFVRCLLENLGVITGYDSAGLPKYNEFYLCAEPQERLFIQGHWQDGIFPQTGLTDEDRRQCDEFFSLIQHYKTAKGHDGRRAFVVPLELSSKDDTFMKLDQLSMSAWMNEKRWTSKPLKWYVNYCCRDDYGATAENVSAWAGIHYFASRVGQAANADSQTVLTWPEGNGWLMEKLRQFSEQEIQTGSLVVSVAGDQGPGIVDVWDTKSQETFRIRAKKVIFAAPRFVGAKVIKSFKDMKPKYLHNLQYSPWMVANVSLKKPPVGDGGAALSWDNVSYYSESLGYIVATHQGLSLFPKKTVLTYYLPLTQKDPATERKMAFQKKHSEWAALVMKDLKQVHPNIAKDIENIDIWLWGHGMSIPKVGFISGSSRKEMLNSLGNLHFAHSDMSGISVFEEAQYRGIIAAINVLESLGERSGGLPG